MDGDKFSDARGFYEEMARLLTKDTDFVPGKKPDALNDLLRGGFGVHAYGEPIVIRWKNAEKSRAELGADMELFCRIIEDKDESGHDCELILY